MKRDRATAKKLAIAAVNAIDRDISHTLFCIQEGKPFHTVELMVLVNKLTELEEDLR